MALPKRAAVAGDLRRRIGDGEFQRGEKLPSLEELRAGYGVSRVTAIQAMDALERQGIVSKRLGRGGGYYVREPLLLDIYAWRDDQPMVSTSEADLFFRTVREQRHEPSQDFTVDPAPMPEAYAALLHVEPGDAAFVRRCIRYVDGIPHSIQDSWYPSWLCERVPRLTEKENIAEGTTRLLAAQGFLQVAARAYQTAETPTAEEARILRIPQADRPVLQSVLTGYTKDGPLRISTAVFGPGTRLVSEHGDPAVLARFRP